MQKVAPNMHASALATSLHRIAKTTSSEECNSSITIARQLQVKNITRLSCTYNKWNTKTASLSIPVYTSVLLTRPIQFNRERYFKWNESLSETRPTKKGKDTVTLAPTAAHPTSANTSSSGRERYMKAASHIERRSTPSIRLCAKPPS